MMCLAELPPDLQTECGDRDWRRNRKGESDMGKLADCAVHKFTEKRYNCCQAVICAVCEEYGVAELDAFKMTEGFGAGMGGLGDTCGDRSVPFPEPCQQRGGHGETQRDEDGYL